MSIASYYQKIFNVSSDIEFKNIALSIANYQFENCEIYRNYCEHINKFPKSATEINEIPFLPIEFFRTHNVIDKSKTSKIEFKSSSTTSEIPSKHLVANPEMYIKSFFSGFKTFYGDASDYCFLALLPSYIEKGDSSLVYMVDKMIKNSVYPQSNFYVHDFEKLHETIVENNRNKIPTILIGVSYALLDYIENYQYTDNDFLIVMETGGMKGKRKEMLKIEMHDILKAGFGVSEIHSEYGMTELLSQAYSSDKGIYKTPKWMKVLIRDIQDPLSIIGNNKSGAINIIDLANIHSCSFVATQDIGFCINDTTFLIQGRMEDSQIRGCNLMYKG